MPESVSSERALLEKLADVLAPLDSKIGFSLHTGTVGQMREDLSYLRRLLGDAHEAIREALADPPPVEAALDVLARLLVAVDAREDEYVLFGSTVLYLHGLRDADSIGDVDVFVSRRVWGLLLAVPDGVVLTPRADDPPLLELPAAPPLHVFYDWTSRDADWMRAERCLKVAEMFGAWPCIPLEELRRHKRLADDSEPPEVRAKHERDLVALDERLGP